MREKVNSVFEAEYKLKAAGFEKIRSVPEGSDVFCRYIVDEAKGPRHITRAFVPEHTRFSESGVYNLEYKSYTRPIMSRIESVWVLRSSFTIPKFSVHHNYIGFGRWGRPISSDVIEHKNSGVCDTSRYCVVETRYLGEESPND